MTWNLEDNVVDPESLQRRQQATDFLDTLRPTADVGQPGGSAPSPQVGGMAVSPMPGLSMPYNGAPIERDSKSVTSKVRTGEERALLADSAKLGEEEVVNLRKEGEVKKQVAEEKARQAQDQAAIQAEYAEKQKALSQETEAEITRRQAITDKAFTEFQQAAPKDFYADKSTGQKIAAVFATALGGFGAAVQSAYGGKPYDNPAVTALNRWVDEDAAKQQANMQHKRETYQMSREGVSDARGVAAEKQKNLDVWKAAAWDKAGAIGVSTLTRMGVPLQEAETNAAVVHAKQKSNEYLTKSAEGMRGTVTNNYMSMSGQNQDPAKQPGYVYGVGGQALAQLRDPKKADDASATIQASRQLRDVLVQLKEMDKGGLAIPGTDAYAERQALANQALIQMKEVQKLGAIQGADMGMLTGQIGSWVERTAGRAGPKLDKALAAVDRGLGEALDRYGLPGKQLAPQALGSAGPATQGAPQGPATKAPAGPASLPAGAVPGEYKGHKGYRLGNKFYVDE